MKKILKGIFITYFTIYLVFQGFPASAFELQSQDTFSDSIELPMHNRGNYLLLTQLQKPDEQITIRIIDNVKLDLGIDILSKKEQPILKLKGKTIESLIMARTIVRCRNNPYGGVDCEEYEVGGSGEYSGPPTTGTYIVAIIGLALVIGLIAWSGAFQDKSSSD